MLAETISIDDLNKQHSKMFLWRNKLNISIFGLEKMSHLNLSTDLSRYVANLFTLHRNVFITLFNVTISVIGHIRFLEEFLAKNKGADI